MAYNPNNANGQATMANSAPVVIASDQSAVPISAASLPLPTGAATGTKQDTGNTSLSSIDGKITAVNTGAVTISAALPTGTNSIGKISDITTSVVPGTAATNLGKAEDAGHSSGDTGVMALAVRNDAGTVLAGSDLDYIPLTTDNVGAAYIGTIGRVSTGNSTTATLTSGSVFTGTSESVKNFASISVSVISDVASATDGLSLQQSSNGTNWDITDTYTIAAATGKVFSVQPIASFFRVVYTNGGTNQASFRLQVVYHTIAAQPSSQRSSDGYTNETDLQQMWSFNSMWNGGTWDRVKGDTTNGLLVNVSSPATVLNNKTTVTTAGTRVVLAASTTCKSVTIKALSTNTGFIYVGSSTVSSINGFQLIAGESISLDITNLNTVNIDSSVNGEGVTYLGIA